MSKEKAILSKKDEKFRKFALEGNMWLVILQVGLPLAMYQELTQLFRILDSMMASHISAESVSAVAYLSQINMMLSAVGGGLAIGGSLRISQAYGAGDYELVRKRVSSLFGLCSILGVCVLVFLLPFTKSILKLANTPQELIDIGNRYFQVYLMNLVVTFLNNVYIAVERARGNSKRILYLNVAVILVKLTLTAFFVYVLESGITMIAVATLISQSILFFVAVHNLNQKGNAFSFSLKQMTFHDGVTVPMLQTSVPVIVEKTSFSLGKVMINSMSGMYGALTVGALGISNSIGGLTTMPQNGFQEGGAAIISQNLGAGKTDRALEAFRKVLLVNVGVGIIGFVLSRVFLNQLSTLFASSTVGMNEEFKQMIEVIYRFESLGGCIPLGINTSIVALLLGFGYTKHTLFINFCRIFAFRIPVLWGLQTFSNLGNESVGIVMLVSNVLVTLLSIMIAVIVIRRICKEKQILFLRSGKVRPINENQDSYT